MPLAALTVAVIVVVAFWAMVDGFAATVVVVAAAATVTLTVAGAEEPLNLLSPP